MKRGVNERSCAKKTFAWSERASGAKSESTKSASGLPIYFVHNKEHGASNNMFKCNAIQNEDTFIRSLVQEICHLHPNWTALHPAGSSINSSIREDISKFCLQF